MAHRRWLSAFLIALALVFASPSFTTIAFAAPGDSMYIRPGERVLVDDHRINVYCIGSGSPAVIFDSGWEDWAPAWHLVQPAVARRTQACSYDRAGSGFSDAGILPRTSVRIADDLHSALHRAGIQPPYVLVGHSFGSYNTRTYVDRYLPEVAGLVLVDGENGDVESAAAQASDHRDYAALVKELRSCRSAVAAKRHLPLIPAGGGHSVSCAQQFFRGLPEKTFSPALNAVVLHIARTRTALYDAVISEMEWMPWDEIYLQRHRTSLGSRPLRVLTAQNHYYDTARTPPALHRKHLAEERIEAKTQARWLPLSSDARQIFAWKSGHYIELDQPSIVLDAIFDVLMKSRTAR